MSTFDAIIKAVGAIGFVLSIVLGAQIYRLGPERRKLDAEGRGTDASSAKVMTESAILWAQEWKDELNELREYVDALEASIDEWTDWARQVADTVERSNNTVLPPRPPRPRRPKPPRRHGGG